MTTQLPTADSASKPGFQLFSASSVKFWGLSGAALAGLMLFPHGQGGEVLTGLSVLGMGGFVLWNRFNPAQLPIAQQPEILTQDHLDRLFQTLTHLFNTIETESQEHETGQVSVKSLRERLAHLQTECDRRQVRLVITGDVGVGKTTLHTVLEQQWLASQPQIQTLSDHGWATAEMPPSILAADLILFVVQGDLTQSERDRLQALKNSHKPVLVLLNKADQFQPKQLEGLTQKMAQVLEAMIPAADQLTLAAAPQSILVRRHQADGSIKEVEEWPQPQLKNLTQRLAVRLSPQGCEQLVWQQVYNETMQLQQDGRRSLNALRRQQALPLIEKYQWVAATAAFASPLPSTDMIATAAITAKLVMDLGKVYRHEFSLAEAQNIATILAQAFLKLGLVELSSQILGSALKSHAATYVAGGLIQGLSVAYLTQIAGLSLAQHFEDMALRGLETTPSQFSLSQMKGIVEQVFANHQRLDFLKGLVSQGVSRLQPAG